MDNPNRNLPIHFLISLLVLDIVISLGITIPLVGVLVRYRAHYSPKAVQLGAEDAVPARTGPTIGGYFSTFKRVYKLEARVFWILHVVNSHLAALLHAGMGWTLQGHDAIVTPVRLPFFGVRQSLRALLSPTERARPWTLYFTPGLVVANLLKIVIALPILKFKPLQRFIIPHVPKTREEIDVHFFLRSIVFTLLIILVTSLLVPLEIIATRLAIQRNHDSQPQVNLGEENVATTPEVPVYSSEEEVIGLRDESDPYTSFRDCLKRIVAEEGRSTLFRAWWISFIPLLAAGILETTKVPKAGINIH
ncbi:hypothetical protein H0H92_010096 [Tricholoma furcatifolium]|nr:hypothetical protein H0H92_010096 [Tricholoma furcatifolium]